MPEIVDGLPRRRGTGGRPESYPWSEWFDGQARRFDRADFGEIKPASFQQAAAKAAKRHGIKIRTRLRDGSVWIQAVVGKDGDDA